jgi:hypothetical protein
MPRPLDLRTNHRSAAFSLPQVIIRKSVVATVTFLEACPESGGRHEGSPGWSLRNPGGGLMEMPPSRTGLRNKQPLATCQGLRTFVTPHLLSPCHGKKVEERCAQRLLVVFIDVSL